MHYSMVVCPNADLVVTPDKPPYLATFAELCICVFVQNETKEKQPVAKKNLLLDNLLLDFILICI